MAKGEVKRMRIAIIGASKHKWKNPKKAEAEVQRAVTSILSGQDPDTTIFVSGGSPAGGVDIWAEKIADELKLKKRIFEPRGQAWHLFMERNKKIAEFADVVYDIEPEGRKRGGGTWTLNYAKRLGKEVHKIEISENLYDIHQIF